MTERRPAARRRLPKRSLRAWAWVSGIVAFLLPMGAIAAQPKVQDLATPRPRPVIRKTLIRRIILTPQPSAPSQPRVVYVGPPAGSAPVPPTTTGGSGLP